MLERLIRLDNMNPYSVTNISLGCLFALKLLISAYNHNQFNGFYITGFRLFGLLVGVGLFYLGILPFAEYFTGQKKITNWGTVGSSVPYDRNERCLVVYLAYSLIFLFLGVLIIMNFDA